MGFGSTHGRPTIARESGPDRANHRGMSLLPDDDGLELMHSRDYETKIYRVSPDELLVRGAVSDRKPPGLYVTDDPEPLEIHQMQLELRVAYPSLEITAARVVFESHPHSECPLIAADYGKLVGLSIARGFTRKTKDLFGGSNGCTHTNALLQAIAPAVIQATWSVRIEQQRLEGKSHAEFTPEERERLVQFNLNTCHVWADGGERATNYREGKVEAEPLLPVARRLKELGRDGSSWP